MVEAAQDGLGGPVDILVNNHGPFSMTPFHQMPADEFAHVMDGNLTLTLRAVQQVVPGMRAGGWGRIVNLSAGSAYLRNHSVYGLAKSAVGMLTESLALELGPEITVNAVAPGQIVESTPDIEDIDPTFVGRALARTPAGRLVSRHEVAEIVAALCAPPFDLLTGAVLPVDGGWRLNRF
jgi:NAD(P)-dependent dehydrogenase (short-subunit alcohol dehydrogenase family)